MTKKNSKPAAYPETDAAEQDAVNVFKTCINTKRVKDDIRTRDKYPNTDGFLELVDKDLVPIGKIEAQVRKIPDGARQYSCSMSLVEYSKVSTLPVVLICVDVENRKPFWKSIYPTMPEIKPGQASFTVYFDESVDEISGDEKYIHGWLSLIEDYKKRISEFPTLQKELADKVTVDSVSPEDKAFFQRYIDSMNSLLDGEFLCIKKLMLPDVWKLGVGIYGADEASVAYQLYKVEYGSAAPLLCAMDGATFDVRNPDRSMLSSHWSTRNHMGDPAKAGTSRVLGYVRDAVLKRNLSVHGLRNCSDMLFSFLDRHAHCFGLKPNRDEYSLADLVQGLSSYLPLICARIAKNMATSTGRDRIVLDFDTVSQLALDGTLKPLDAEDSGISFGLYSSRTQLKPISESLRYLSANRIPTVRRILKPRQQPDASPSQWIWSGYSEQDLAHNVLSVLENSLDEYSAFLQGNMLQMRESSYLDPTTAIVMVCEHQLSEQPSRCGGWPMLRQYFVENPDRALPKLTVSLCRPTDPSVDLVEFQSLRVNGTIFQCKSWKSSAASFLFHSTPHLNMTYSMLCDDLERNYEIGHMPGQFAF